MKNLFILIIIALQFNSCSAQKLLIQDADSIQIDYVDLYVMTPVNVRFQNFYTYFGKSVQTITITDKNIISKTIKELNEFFNSSEKAKLLPDTRLIVTLYYKKDTQVITIGTTLLNTKNESHIANDNIRECFGKLTNNQW